MMRIHFIAVLALATAGCMSREQAAQQMANQYDIPFQAALYIENQCPSAHGESWIITHLEGCRRRAARQWSEANGQPINTDLSVSGGGGAVFFFAPR